MQDRITRKIVQWWVFLDQKTQRWGYSNKEPEKCDGLIGPVSFDKAKDLVYQKNREVKQ